MRILSLGTHHLAKGLLHLGCEVIKNSDPEPNLPLLLKEIGEVDWILLTEPLGRRTFPIGLEKVKCKKAFYGIDIHLNYSWQKYFAKLFDVVFVTQNSYAKKLQREGARAYFMPWAIDPEDIFDHNLPRDYDLVFVGLIDPQRRYKRAKLLEYIEQFYTVKKFGTTLKSRLSHKDMSIIYSRAKIAINEAISHELNFRVFETLACGTLLLTEPLDGLDLLFTDKKDLVVFQPKNVVELIHYYLTHDDLRKSIAKSGKEKVLKYHTIYKRAEEILNIFESHRTFISNKKYFYYNLGKALYFAARKPCIPSKTGYMRALVAFQHLRRFNWAKIFIAVLYENLGKPHLARKIVKELLKSKNSNPTAYALAGFFAYKDKDYKKSAEYYKKIYKGDINFKKPDFWFNIAQILKNFGEDFFTGGIRTEETAPFLWIDYVAQTLRIQPNYRDACFILADRFYRAKIYDCAAIWYIAGGAMNTHGRHWTRMVISLLKSYARTRAMDIIISKKRLPKSLKKFLKPGELLFIRLKSAN